MQFSEVGAVSGQVFRVERKKGPVGFAKYREPDGRQVKRKIGPAWTGIAAACAITRGWYLPLAEL